MAAILLVDDNELFTRSLARVLKTGGHEATVAHGVDMAWSALERARFDLVLTDLQMAPHSGLELIQAMQQAHPDTGPILMTGFASERDCEQALSWGALAILVKPFSNADLDAAIQQALVLRIGLHNYGGGPGLIDTLHMFHLDRRTLQLDVEGDARGCVQMRQGEVISARCADGGPHGIPALRRLLAGYATVVRTGTLPPDAIDTVATPFSNLLLDAAPRPSRRARPPCQAQPRAALPWEAASHSTAS